MDDIVRSTQYSGAVVSDRQQIETLTRENQRLRETLASLRAAARFNAAAPASEQLRHLRAANEQLVLATFGAQDSKTAAEALNRRQAIFLSMLAHELRNPLAPICAANSLLERLVDAHPLLPKLSEVLRRQLNHLVHLVDDLLDASRIDNGKISLHKGAVTLQEIIDSAIETVQPAIDARGQDMRISLPSVPVELCADLVRLTQLFSNLLINASKFSDANATIWLSASVQDDTVVVSVKDLGVGIAPTLQTHIFELFTQGEQTLARAAGGLGIGLSLVRTIAEMHGGAVTVHSEGAGSGSEFLVALPLSQQAPTFPPLPPGSAAAG